jgi:small neutral amino acid transporter SnatA (MarC family)
MLPENKQKKYTNKLTLLAFKIIIILHNTRLATFIKLLETVSKGIDSRTAVTRSWIAAALLFVFWYHSPNVLDTPHI